MTHGDKMKAAILAAGVKRWPDVTVRAIGRDLGISHTAVLYHMTSADGLRDAVAAYAVETGCSAVIVQLIAARHPAAARLAPADRARHMATVR